MSVPPNRQLALDMGLRDDCSFDSFLPGHAQLPLLTLLRGQAGAGGEPVIFLHGVAGSGKSHLLQAACQLVGAGGCYLPLRELVAMPGQELLQGLEARRLVCLDDVEALAGHAPWEEALFHFFNRARARDCRLLLAAAGPPASLGLGLPDLSSRLGWGPVFQLQAPDDERRQAILVFRAGCRGLQMPADVARFLVSRVPRDPGRLMEMLLQLDRRSLADQRALTIPFVKQALQL